MISEYWCNTVTCCDPVWEDAYRRFESPEQEIRKFRRRLIALGASRWPRDATVVEIFCGRGNGLRALESLGFTNLIGVDLSETLLRSYDGPAQLYVGDCRNLKFDPRSIDIVIVQGGLHHLPDLVGDLDLTLREVQRVLRPGGLFVAIEPWSTPFLRLVHACCGMAIIRRCWPKLDALATMIERERMTYEMWLSNPRAIRELLQRRFLSDSDSARWGKLVFVGRTSPVTV